jgi:hypothetical protein
VKQRASNPKPPTTWTVTAEAAAAGSDRLPADRLRRLMASLIAQSIAKDSPELPGVKAASGSGVDGSAKGGE